MTTESGTYNCESGELCEIDIVDTAFDETFIAAPDDGYLFLRWKALPGHLCGNSTDPCRQFTAPLALDPFFLSFLDADNLVFSLQPEFALEDDVSVVDGYQMNAGAEDAILALEVDLTVDTALSIPYVFTGDSDSSSVTATFNGMTLVPLVDTLDASGLAYLVFETDTVAGQSGTLRLVLSTVGKGKAELLIISDARPLGA